MVVQARRHSITAISSAASTPALVLSLASTQEKTPSGLRAPQVDAPPLTDRDTDPEFATGFLSQENLRKVVFERRKHFVRYSIYWLLFAVVVLTRSVVVYMIYFR
ncbi:hypothetical protein KIPB_014803, partial [Kipferlia bialata]|eukprot:g14803.t1